MNTRQRAGFGLLILNLGLAIITPDIGVGDAINAFIALIGFFLFVSD